MIPDDDDDDDNGDDDGGGDTDSDRDTMAMEQVVPAEISSELIQILSNLVLGDNDIRQR